MLNNLPTEILLEIFSRLSPEQAAIAKRVNTTTRDLMQDGPFWKQKFQKHFPHLYDELRSQSGVNWFLMFRKAYADEYMNLKGKIRKLFSLVKEGDIESVKQMMTFDDFYKADKGGCDLLYWAVKMDNQALLDYFYSVAAQHYADATGLAIDPAKTDSYKRTFLHWAIYCRQPAETIALLLSQKVALNAVTHHQNTALMAAAARGQAEIAELLIGHGINIDASNLCGATALLIAIEYNHKNVVDILLKHNANTNMQLVVNDDCHTRFKIVAGDTPLHAAIKLGRIEIVRALLDKGVAIDTLINHRTALMLAAEIGHAEIAELLISRGIDMNTSQHGYTALLLALVNNKTNVVDVLLRHNADTTFTLHAAIKCGRIDIVRALLDQGVAIDAVINHRTALILAAKERRNAIAELLIHRGANINARTQCGATALLIAVEDKNIYLVDILLEHNADTSIPLHTESAYHTRFKSVVGDTPLHAAARSGYSIMVRRLISSNANGEALNSQQKTPLGVAPKKSCCFHVLRLLRSEARLNRLPDGHHKKSFTVFGHTFKFGPPVKLEKDATHALTSVVFHGANRACLRPHKDVLKHGELKSVCRKLHMT